ncbi:uncharacterized protein isoform X2 [Musca autumnalis]|uniref:uncharacterized protein isoform X2 n=1 Tax=Musca autumnalis TaxID=221902 RepID=UPI003CE7B38D
MYAEIIQLQCLAYVAIGLFGLISAQAVGSKDLFRCRQSCYQKFVQDWHHCMDFEDCKSCWNNCDQQLGPFPLNINSALRQGSLVITDVAWDQAITNASKQCLVTWEVSGGGLMGNLLTDSSTVELSLWSDTVYHVQVTCKHKETGGMRRSFKLIVDTHKLGDSTATSMQAISMDSQFGGQHLPSIYGAENIPQSHSETESRLRILKDSSKDFLAPYNPDIPIKTKTSKNSNQEDGAGVAQNEITYHDSVLRTKLIGVPASVESLSFAQNSVIVALMGSSILFLVVVIMYLIMRPVRKQVPAVITPNDKQVLIQTEMRPHQRKTEPAPVHHHTSHVPVAASLSPADQSPALHV